MPKNLAECFSGAKISNFHWPRFLRSIMAACLRLLLGELQRQLELFDGVIDVAERRFSVAAEIVFGFAKLGAAFAKLVERVADVRVIDVFLVDIRVDLACALDVISDGLERLVH